MEIRAFVGQAEKRPNIGPITMNLDEAKWDRIPPMSRTFLGGSGGRRVPNLVMLGVGGSCIRKPTFLTLSATSQRRAVARAHKSALCGDPEGQKERARACTCSARRPRGGSLPTRGHQVCATAQPETGWRGQRSRRQGQTRRPERWRGKVNALYWPWPKNDPIWVRRPLDKCTGGETGPKKRSPLVPRPSEAKKGPKLPKFKNLHPIYV